MSELRLAVSTAQARFTTSLEGSGVTSLAISYAAQAPARLVRELPSLTTDGCSGPVAVLSGVADGVFIGE